MLFLISAFVIYFYFERPSLKIQKDASDIFVSFVQNSEKLFEKMLFCETAFYGWPCRFCWWMSDVHYARNMVISAVLHKYDIFSNKFSIFRIFGTTFLLTYSHAHREKTKAYNSKQYNFLIKTSFLRKWGPSLPHRQHDNDNKQRNLPHRFSFWEGAIGRFQRWKTVSVS